MKFQLRYQMVRLAKRGKNRREGCLDEYSGESWYTEIKGNFFGMKSAINSYRFDIQQYNLRLVAPGEDMRETPGAN